MLYEYTKTSIEEAKIFLKETLDTYYKVNSWEILTKYGKIVPTNLSIIDYANQLKSKN
jgi:hypothetical protein